MNFGNEPIAVLLNRGTVLSITIDGTVLRAKGSGDEHNDFFRFISDHEKNALYIPVSAEKSALCRRSVETAEEMV